MEKKFKKIIKEFKDYLIITLGLLCYTTGWIVFMIASLFFDFIPRLIPQEFIQELALSNGKMLSCLIAGALSGIGIGITFGRGGSTGGTDIVALMINKYRNISAGKIILFIDVFIIASSMLIPSDANIGSRLANVMYVYIMVIACSYTVDLMVAGTKQSIQIFIFSKSYDKIPDAISSDLRRGVTVIDAKGWYTKEDGKVLLVVLRKTESNLLYRIVKDIDRNAFISVGSVMGVYGSGFDTIKK